MNEKSKIDLEYIKKWLEEEYKSSRNQDSYVTIRWKLLADIVAELDELRKKHNEEQ